MSHRQDQKALMILQFILVAVVIGALIFLLLKKGIEKPNNPDDTLAADAYSLQDKQGGNHDNTGLKEGTGRGGAAQDARMTFDPNTADSATLVAVGLTPWQAHNLLRYRSKGGQYHRPEDLKKLYSLTVKQWEQIAPLIRIGREFQYLADVEDVYASSYPTRRRPANNGYSSNYSGYSSNHSGYSSNHSGYASSHSSDANVTSQQRSATDNLSNEQNGGNEYPKKLRQGETVNLNTSDTTALKRIPGIGSYYSKRIADYREKLGGFVSINQLNDEELNCLPLGIEKYLSLPNSSIRPLRINKLSVRELKNHPYISYQQAKQLADRVRLYGPFKTWDEILFLSTFCEADKARLLPYVSFE